MNHQINQKVIVYLVLLIGLFSPLISCSPMIEENDLQNSQGTLVTPTPQTSVQIATVITPTTMMSTLEPTSTPKIAATATATATNVNENTMVSHMVHCQGSSALPNKTVPTQIDLSSSDNQRVAITNSFLYLATGHYIGVFDISDSAKPKLLGFWDFPDWPDISNLKVHNGVAYFTSGSDLVLLNLSEECLFETIVTLEIPFQVFQIEIDGNRLYVDEASIKTGENQVAIFSILDPSNIQELGVVDLGQLATWSIFEDKLYSLSNQLTVYDVSNPSDVYTQPVNLTLDSEVLAYSPATFFKDHLHILWESYTLTIINNMLGQEPNVISNPQKQILTGDLSFFTFEAFENYTFLGGYSCDNSCNSYVTVFNSVDGQELFNIGFSETEPPIHSYHEISSDIVYAFSDDHLLILDISNFANPKIAGRISLLE